MYILSNRKSYIEYYDVVESKDNQYQELLTSLADVKEKYRHLNDTQTSPAWYEDLLTVITYKSTTSAADSDLQSMLAENVAVYTNNLVDKTRVAFQQTYSKRSLVQKQPSDSLTMFSSELPHNKTMSYSF